MPVDPTSWIKRTEEARRREKAIQDDERNEPIQPRPEGYYAQQAEKGRYVQSDR
jgi:hypothetical protein